MDLSFGKMDGNSGQDNFDTSAIRPSKTVNGYDYTFGYNVGLNGKAEVRPTV